MGAVRHASAVCRRKTFVLGPGQCLHSLTWLLLTLWAGSSMAASSQWSLQKDEDRIQLYTRAVEGSPFLEVKAVVTIDAPMDKVLAQMGNGDGCTEWRAMCKSSRVFKRVSDTERYVYVVMDLPWPVADRDMVVHSVASVDRESQTVSVEANSASALHPPQDYVRAESSFSYLIRALGEERVEFTLLMHTDLGGNLPPKQFNIRLPSVTFKDMKRLVALAEN